MQQTEVPTTNKKEEKVKLRYRVKERALSAAGTAIYVGAVAVRPRLAGRMFGNPDGLPQSSESATVGSRSPSRLRRLGSRVLDWADKQRQKERAEKTVPAPPTKTAVGTREATGQHKDLRMADKRAARLVNMLRIGSEARTRIWIGEGMQPDPAAETKRPNLEGAIATLSEAMSGQAAGLPITLLSPSILSDQNEKPGTGTAGEYVVSVGNLLFQAGLVKHTDEGYWERADEVSMFTTGDTVKSAALTVGIAYNPDNELHAMLSPDASGMQNPRVELTMPADADNRAFSLSIGVVDRPLATAQPGANHVR